VSYDPTPSPQQLPVFNLAPTHRPARVHAATPSDDLAVIVADAVRDHGRIHVVGAGHGLAAPIEGGLALLTGGLRDVQVDLAARTARVRAGTRWSEVLAATTGHGLAPVCGSAPGVGVVGFLLGGGLGPVGRTVGWGSDHARSFEMVTATGHTVHASADSHPDLYWALRGGNLAPGVVTAVELDLLPLSTLYGGGLFFAASDADTVLAGYASWAAGLPDAVTSSCALLRLPDLGSVPPPLRGRFVVHVRVAVVGVGDPASYVGPLRALAPAIVDTVAEMPYAALGAIHADPSEPMPVLEGGVLLREVDAGTAAALLDVVGPQTGAPFAAVEVRQLGGALAAPVHAPDAVVGREAGFSLFAVSAPAPPLFTEVVPAAARRLFDAMAPWATGRVQPNFTGGLNRPAALAHAWEPDVASRLHEVWRSYDPTGVFTGLHT
jgi:hypothetical protein